MLQGSSHFSMFLRKWMLWKNIGSKAMLHGIAKAQHAPEDPEGTEWGDKGNAGCACHKQISPPKL